MSAAQRQAGFWVWPASIGLTLGVVAAVAIGLSNEAVRQRVGNAHEFLVPILLVEAIVLPLILVIHHVRRNQRREAEKGKPHASLADLLFTPIYLELAPVTDTQYQVFLTAVSENAGPEPITVGLARIRLVEPGNEAGAIELFPALQPASQVVRPFEEGTRRRQGARLIRWQGVCEGDAVKAFYRWHSKYINSVKINLRIHVPSLDGIWPDGSPSGNPEEGHTGWVKVIDHSLSLKALRWSAGMFRDLSSVVEKMDSSRPLKEQEKVSDELRKVMASFDGGHQSDLLGTGA